MSRPDPRQADYYRLGSWLFLFGSLAFAVDAAIALAATPSLTAGLYLFGCLLFAIGSGLFVLDRR